MIQLLPLTLLTLTLRITMGFCSVLIELVGILQMEILHFISCISTAVCSDNAV